MLNARQKLLVHKIRIFASEKVSSFFDAVLYKINVPVPVRKHQKILLFVGQLLPARTGRMAKWIRRSDEGYDVVLLCHKQGYTEAFSEDGFDSVYLFRNEWHMRRILARLSGNISIVHGLGPSSRFADIARTQLNKPYIHDMQDVLSNYYDDEKRPLWVEKELPHELNCILKADGIVAQSMEMNQVLRKHPEVKRPKTLFFPMYCDEDSFQPVSLQPLDLNEIHIVYVGGVAGSHRDRMHYGNIQFRDLIEVLTSQQLHFHIYPSPYNLRSDWEEYTQIALENPRFHFHPSVSQEELARDISNYQFGIIPFFRSLSNLSDIKLKYATSLKLFNYLESGLPVIVSEDIGFQNWMIDRHHCGITITEKNIGNLFEIIASTDYKQLKQQVEKTRIKLSLEDNTKRLLAFYKSL